MIYNKLPKKTNDEIFSSVESSIEYLVDENLVKKERLCSRCGDIMIICNDNTYIYKRAYRCRNVQCRKRESVFLNTYMDVARKPINDKLLAIYEYLARDYERRVLNDCSMSKSTYQKLKKNLVEYFRIKNNPLRNIMIGGNNSVQIDETVIYKGSFIKSPSNVYDDMSGLTWLVGLIEENTGRIYIEVVENWKSETLAKLIKNHVYVATLIITDGHPSYPKAVQDSLCMHEIVNHRLGFKNKNGFSTNNIENVWSLMRYEEAKRKGIKKSSVPAFLEEFIFRYYNLKSSNFKEIASIWYDIVKFFIENKKD